MGLTPKQEKFIQNIIAGMSQREAYKNSYNTTEMTNKTIDEAASRLFNDSKINARYKELIEELQDKAIMSAKERMKWLTEVINNEQQEDIYITSEGISVKVGSKNADLSTKIKALDTLNKMSGEYITKVEADVGLKTIRVELEDE